MQRITSLASRLTSSLPILRAPLDYLYGKYFNRVGGHARLFRGVYRDFAAARKAIPRDRLEGYNNSASAKRLNQDLYKLFPFDYPILFWLSTLLPHCKRVFDWGGNVGLSYFAFRKYVVYPPDLDWLVNDVPAVVEQAKAMIEGLDAPGLRFTTEFGELGNADLLLSAGTLQFIEDPFTILRKSHFLPGHVLVNKVPVYARASAVTLQNMGTALSPNHLFNRASFVREFKNLGYQLIDEWETPDMSCEIPFFRDHSIRAYSGFYFRK